MVELAVLTFGILYGFFDETNASYFQDKMTPNVQNKGS